LAIASFVFCPVVLAIVALVLASTAKRNIANSGGTVTGESLAQAGTIVAWINIGLSVLVVVLIIVVAAASSPNDSSDAFGAVVPLLS
jgi:hypothetical protein